MSAAQAETAAVTFDEVRAEFTDWGVFATGGRVFAFRLDDGWQAREGPESLLLAVVSAPDPQTLARQLAQQEWLESLSPGDLAALWKRKTGGRR